MRKTALLASALALTLSACGNRDFNKPSLLDKPRILAVKAEPPQPSYGQTTTLSALVYQPPIGRVPSQCADADATSATYAWEWCPVPMVADTAHNTYKCPITKDDLAGLYASLGLGEAPDLILGDGETMPFVNPFPAQFLYALCRGDIGSAGGIVAAGGDQKSAFSCDLPWTDAAANAGTPPRSETHPISFNITVKVTVTPACPDLLPDGFKSLAALYSLHLPTDDTIPNNQNPVLSGIFTTENFDPPDGGVPAATTDQDTVDGGVSSDDGGGPVEADGGQAVGAGHDGPDGSVRLEDDAVVEVKRNKHVGLLLDTDIGIAEYLPVPSNIDYTRADSIAGKPALLRHYEHLSLDWFAEAGDFNGLVGDYHTGYTPTGLPIGQDNPPDAQDIKQFQDNIANRLDLPKRLDYGYDTVRITVVVRDGRGGVGWTSKQVTLEPTP